MAGKVAERTRKIAIALSGGEHRASLFGLGVSALPDGRA